MTFKDMATFGRFSSCFFFQIKATVMTSCCFPVNHAPYSKGSSLKGKNLILRDLSLLKRKETDLERAKSFLSSTSLLSRNISAASLASVSFFLKYSVHVLTETVDIFCTAKYTSRTKHGRKEK